MRTTSPDSPPASVQQPDASQPDRTARADRLRPRRLRQRLSLAPLRAKLHAHPAARNVILRIIALAASLPLLALGMHLLSAQHLVGTTARLYLFAGAVVVLLAALAALTVTELFRDDRPSREELELIIHERTHSLSEANRDLEAFGMTVSHDLRSPLWALEASARTLLDSAPMNATVRDGLDLTRRTAKKMRETVDGLHDLSQATVAPLKLERCSPDRIAREALVLLGGEQRAEQAMISIDPMPDAIGDPRLLRIVYRNLIANALKFALPGRRPMILVGCDHHYDLCVYSVEDNGPGFDPNGDDPFQLGARFDPKVPGTGIGLPTVRKIIERLGGRIWIDSVPGSGTSVSFTLPPSTDRLGFDLWSERLLNDSRPATSLAAGAAIRPTDDRGSRPRV